MDGANLYGYTRGNPIGALDPYGLDTVDDHGGIRDPSTITPIQAPGVGGEDMAAQAGTGNPWVDFWWEHMQVDRTGRFEWDDPGWWNRFWAGSGGAAVEWAAWFVLGVAAGTAAIIVGGYAIAVVFALVVDGVITWRVVHTAWLFGTGLLWLLERMENSAQDPSTYKWKPRDYVPIGIEDFFEPGTKKWFRPPTIWDWILGLAGITIDELIRRARHDHERCKTDQERGSPVVVPGG